MKISAKIIAHSKNEYGNEIATMICTFPRFILAELNTHRVFSRNSASSRAIPFNKMVKNVKENPFIPIAWQKEHKGMQGTEYFNQIESDKIERNWLLSKDFAVNEATSLSSFGVTKQLANRLLEPAMWHTAIITSTEWENFFWLRCPNYVAIEAIDTESGEGIIPTEVSYRSRKDFIKDYPLAKSMSEIEWLELNEGQAEIHMMALAEAMYDALNESTPKELQGGEWHIPFGDTFDEERLMNETKNEMFPNQSELNAALEFQKVMVATARCARVSYLNFEGKDNYVTDIDLCKSLIQRPYTNLKGVTFAYDDPVHASPAEHCAKAMGDSDLDKFFKVEGGIVDPGWCRNFKGFLQYRYLIEQ